MSQRRESSSGNVGTPIKIAAVAASGALWRSPLEDSEGSLPQEDAARCGTSPRPAVVLRAALGPELLAEAL